MDVEEKEQDDIRNRTIACEILFDRCLSRSLRAGRDWVEDRQGEFNLWAATLRANSVGRASLDYRVRDNPDIRELVCDLLAGLSEALNSLLQKAGSDSEGSNIGFMEKPSSTSEDDDESLFSEFSSDETDTDVINGASEANDLPPEQMFNIKLILGQLVRISTAIRRSGAKFRYRKADESLKEDDFMDFKTHLTAVILMGAIKTGSEQRHNINELHRLVTDSRQLTSVQKRLIHANVLRRNRIMFATRSVHSKKATKSKPSTTPTRPIAEPSSITLPAPESHRKADKLVTLTPSVSSAIAPSVAHTATEIGSNIDLGRSAGAQKSSPSVVTRVTRTGAVLDYPSCPRLNSEDLLQCPYCADILPADYSKNPNRWRGHIVQDIIPYTCIFEECETPNHMYLTSDELLKHTRNEHGVSGWVCDPCASKSAMGTAPCFQRIEDWEAHMKIEHTDTFKLPQLSSLARLSHRKVLKPLGCPICGYVTETPQPTFDEHITQHLHEFALRCLPWSAGSIDGDSIDAKSARESHLNDDLEADDIEVALPDIDPTDPKSLLRAIEVFRSPEGTRSLDAEQVYRAIWLDNWKEQRSRLLKVLLLVDFGAFKRHATILSKQQSFAFEELLIDSDSTAKNEKRNKSGKLRNFTNTSSPGFPTSKDALQENLLSRVMRILFLLRHAMVTWLNSPRDSFELYREGKRLLESEKREADFNSIDAQLILEWQDLGLEEKKGYRGNGEKDDMAALSLERLRFKARVFGHIRVLLEDEMDEMESACGNAPSAPISQGSGDSHPMKQIPVDIDTLSISKEERLNTTDIALGADEGAVESQRITHPVVMAIIHEVVDSVFEYFPATLESEITRRLQRDNSLEGSAVQDYLRIYDQGGGNAEKILQIAREEQLEERLAYWLELTVSALGTD